MGLVTPKPDIIALQEIEGQRVISDLIRDFLRGGYQVAMSPTSDGAIRVALLSRFPLRSLRIHRSVAVALSPGPTPRPPVYLWRSREMVDTEIDAAGVIRVIVCHWKSQSGGEQKTEPQRIQSAALLRTMLADNGGKLPTLIVGDLNEDIEEFRQHGGAYPTALMPVGTVSSGSAVPDTAERGVAASGAGRSLFVTATPEAAGIRPEGVVLYSPWLASPIPGSYYHAGRWERLDHVLLLPGSGGELRVSLRVVDDDALVTDDGRPARYDPRSGYGYSDHLPVVVQVSMEEVD